MDNFINAVYNFANLRSFGDTDMVSSYWALLCGLPVAGILICALLIRNKRAGGTAARSLGTMQRNCSKLNAVGSAIKTLKDTQMQQNTRQNQQHLNSKNNDSSDSGISTKGRHHQSSTGKQRKTRNNNNNSNSNNNNNNNNSHKRQDGKSKPQRLDAGGSAGDSVGVDGSIGGDMLECCYNHPFMSGRAKRDKIAPRYDHHRNSTSSEAPGSEEEYTVVASNKKTSSRQKRKQKKQIILSNNNNNINNKNRKDDNKLKPATTNAIDEMDGDKENKISYNLHNGKQCNPAAVTDQVEPNSNISSYNQTAFSKKIIKNMYKSSSASSQQYPLAATYYSNYNNANNSNYNNNNNKNSNGNSNYNNNNSIYTSKYSSFSSSMVWYGPNSSNDNSPMGSPKRYTDHYKKKIAEALVSPTLWEIVEHNVSEEQLAKMLLPYVMDPNLMRVYGFPVESVLHAGSMEVYKCMQKPFGGSQSQQQPQQQQQQQQQQFDPFSVINTSDGLYTNYSSVPEWQQHVQIASTTCAPDSGQGTADCSPQALDSDSSEVAEEETIGITAFYTPDGSYQIFSQYDQQTLPKQCVRCQRQFEVTDAGEYITRESCYFHWGKLNHIYSKKGFSYQYTCCLGDESSQGCTFNLLHVWTGVVVGLNGPYQDFVHTRQREVDEEGMPIKVYALDCEMSFTGRGLDITKVTVIAHNGQLVYEHFVRPQAEIADYNTRFSGVTAEDLCEKSLHIVKTLDEVQHDLLELFDAETILVGHGLDNDLRALRISHKRLVDTSINFPHASGFPYRRSLKHLTKVCLNRDIQCSQSGHSSYEDSRASLELMLWKLRKELMALADVGDAH